jgi:hypothetical protein
MALVESARPATATSDSFLMVASFVAKAERIRREPVKGARAARREQEASLTFTGDAGHRFGR